MKSTSKNRARALKVSSTTIVHRSNDRTGEKPLARIDAVPPLRNGDHLTVPEFERRYWAMPEANKTELIEGIVIMPSPVSPIHGDAHAAMNELMRRYARATPGVGCFVNTSTKLDGNNEYQPDAFLRIKEGKQAGTKIGKDGLFDGAPEFVAEITLSSAAYDLHEKKDVYQRNQVREYLVWLALDSQILWFSLEKGEFVELKPTADETIRSHVFPGFWLDIKALLADDFEKVLRTLDKGIKSPEHRAFVKHLAKKEKN